MARLKQMGQRISSAPPRIKPPPKRAELFYQSPEWRSMAAQIKRDRGCYCQRCGSGQRVIADHIRERKDGGADLDPRNIELLCHKCHARKTAQAKRARAMGDGARGRGVGKSLEG